MTMNDARRANDGEANDGATCPDASVGIFASLRHDLHDLQDLQDLHDLQDLNKTPWHSICC
jgi:hypothetical protein